MNRMLLFSGTIRFFSFACMISGILSGSVSAQPDILYKEDFENYASEGAFGAVTPVNGWLQNSTDPNNAIRNLWCSYSGANYCPTCTYPTAGVRIINGIRSAQICYINASNTIAWDGSYYGVGTYNTANTTTDRHIYHTVNSTGYQNIVLTFNWKCAGEIYSGNPVDYGQAGYRIGTGGNWTKLTSGGYNNTGKLCNTAQAVNAATYNLPAVCNDTTFQIAFFWNNDNTGGSGPAFIVDDIVVAGARIVNGYCRPYHQYGNCSPWNDCQYVGITNVSCGSINNTTTITNSPPAYSDYTAYSTNVDANSTYNAGVRYSDNGNPVNYGKIAVWIDFNGDFDFLDANEYLGQQQATTNNQVVSFSFTVPQNAYNGSVVMRVRCAYDDEGFSNTDPCSARDYGETEDYTLNISNVNTQITQPVKEYCTVMPNPASDVIRVKNNDPNNPVIRISLTDLSGRIVFQKKGFQCQNEIISLEGISDGIYIVKLTTISEQQSVIRLIVSR